MEPVRAGAVHDGELVHIALAGRDRETRVAVHIVGHMQAMPMNDGRLRQAVDQVDAQALAAAHADGGPEIGAGRRIERTRISAQQLAPVAPHPREGPGPNGNLVRDCLQFDVDIGSVR